MGVSAVANGYCYILMSIAFISGNLVSRRLVKSTPIDELLMRAHFIFSGGALAFLLFSLYSPLNFWPMLILMAVINVGNGFIFPLSVAGGVTTFPAFPGVASGLLGACQMGGGGAASLIVSASPKDSRSMSLLVMACAIAGLAAFLALRRSAPSAKFRAAETVPSRDGSPGAAESAQARAQRSGAETRPG
jgi:DHA1 family bicyclomycin/chloramphenicol resistance-like MFS transporter